jgi:hypothetical protein
MEEPFEKISVHQRKWEKCRFSTVPERAVVAPGNLSAELSQKPFKVLSGEFPPLPAEFAGYLGFFFL